GIQISYAEQPKPEGLAQAFLIGESFIGGEPVSLILGDNLFYGFGLAKKLQSVASLTEGAKIFGYYVKDPERYGVVEYDATGTVVGLEEKPEVPKSNYAVPGLYFYDRHVVDMAKSLKPSARGELEITDLNRLYLEQGNLSVELMGRGYAWLDTGTHQSLLQAASFIQIVEERQGLKIGCLEEVAYRMGYIDLQALHELGEALGKSTYGQYILDVAREESASS
ncbi:MAG: sugar phosphate nucleotidyltransferase, partial [Myxococcota bacterium]|nr:sugar phosphate nucleotidyltransferase [Myxococcota bacterium]